MSIQLPVTSGDVSSAAVRSLSFSDMDYLPRLEQQFWKQLQRQEPNSRYRQICPDHKLEIYWLEKPVRNGKLDDIPFCTACGSTKSLNEWLVLDSWKGEILYSGKLKLDAEEEAAALMEADLDEALEDL